jgi:hypothetical protein
MRCLLLTSAVLLAAAFSAASAETPQPSETIRRTVYLDSVVLEEMKQSDPRRYERVRKIMASASEICRPNAARQWHVADVQADCSNMFLKTSYPPKRQIAFAIEDTTYIALVTVLDAPPLRKAEPGQVIPLELSK